VLYYKRKLATYNLTVFDGVRRKAKCFVWHEGEGKRGTNEVASCIEEFIQEHCNEHPNTKEFVFYSDNCYGPNKRISFPS